jgi:CheY-like chemotaxis protein/nitrogen-specific signal transduction histidine kinase
MIDGTTSSQPLQSDRVPRSEVEEVRERLEGLVATHQRLVERERLSAFRQMAGEAAHEFAETLSGILARAQNLIDDERDEDVVRAARMIEQVALAGTRTVRRLQEFSRTSPAGPLEEVDLNQLVGEVADAVRARWSKSLAQRINSSDVQVETAPLPLISGDPAELRLALMVVAENAADAMPEGGILTFRTGVDGPRVFCRVADTGGGMTDEVQRWLFDPFFTTKCEKRPGFGLSGAYAIVDRHRGLITVESELCKGSAFTIWLPVAPSREMTPSPLKTEATTTTPAHPSPPGKAKILVVDDSEEVRDVLRDILVRQGHAVVTCADGEAGLAEATARQFDLAMVDLALPGISGLEVASRLKRRSPDSTVVVMTGYFDRVGTGAKGVDFVLTKPFSLDQVRLMINRVYTHAS